VSFGNGKDIAADQPRAVGTLNGSLVREHGIAPDCNFDGELPIEHEGDDHDGYAK
jgi:hypothetical protein